MFETRIETAIQRYCARRKLHNDTRDILNRFLTYGGINCQARQFTGGLTKNEMDGMDAEDIAMAKANHVVASYVEHTDKWIVDFAAVASAFL